MGTVIIADARHLPLATGSVDLVLTSPPYWRKRDYGHPAQLGQEGAPSEYVANIRACLREARRVLRRHGSVFLNVGDSYHRRCLAGIPARIEDAAREDGWLIRNRIIWAKVGGMPEPARDRLANRHEYVLHLAASADYFYDLFALSREHGGANPGDVWRIEPERGRTPHLAPFPYELARRGIALACPDRVCATCGQPARRVVRRGRELDPARPQARRAMELAHEHGLTDAHIAAIQATGISDAGKARVVQTGTGRNSAQVQRLAAEAKAVLGGYFREFTFARPVTAGWDTCGHDAPQPGVVLDPFAGTGTTLRAAAALGRRGIGCDLLPVSASHAHELPTYLNAA